MEVVDEVAGSAETVEAAGRLPVCLGYPALIVGDVVFVSGSSWSFSPPGSTGRVGRVQKAIKLKED